MKIIEKLPFYASVSMLALAIAMPVGAQETEEDEQEAVEELEEVSVTGSFIPRDAYNDIAPLTVIDEEEMKKKGLDTRAALACKYNETPRRARGLVSCDFPPRRARREIDGSYMPSARPKLIASISSAGMSEVVEA